MANGGRQSVTVPGWLPDAAPLAAAPLDAFSESSSSESGYYSDVSSVSTLTDILNRYTVTYEPEYSVKIRKGCADYIESSYHTSRADLCDSLPIGSLETNYQQLSCGCADVKGPLLARTSTSRQSGVFL